MVSAVGEKTGSDMLTLSISRPDPSLP